MSHVLVDTVSSAAAALGVSEDTVRALADDGVLPVAAKTRSGTRLFSTVDVAALVEQRRMSTRYRRPTCDE